MADQLRKFLNKEKSHVHVQLSSQLATHTVLVTSQPSQSLYSSWDDHDSRCCCETLMEEVEKLCFIRGWLSCIQGCMGGDIRRKIDVQERIPQLPRQVRRSSQERRNCSWPFATKTFQSMLTLSKSMRHNIRLPTLSTSLPICRHNGLRRDQCTQGPLGMWQPV